MLQYIGSLAQMSLKAGSIIGVGAGLYGGLFLTKGIAQVAKAVLWDKEELNDIFSKNKKQIWSFTTLAASFLGVGALCTKLAYMSTRLPSSFTSASILDSIKFTNWTEYVPAVVSK